MTSSPSNPRLPIHAATGTDLTARSWQTEAPLRMLMNNLDPEVAEDPDHLVVYGGTGRAARSWEAYDAIVETLRDLRGVGVDLATIGQYLRPSRAHIPMDRVYHPREFRELADAGYAMGFRHVASGPMVRSSYLADEFQLPPKA